MSNFKFHQQGFTLLEALIAVVIIAIGLLGLSGMQMISLRNTNEGFLRTQATASAHDMAERIRANSIAVENNIFASFDSASPSYCSTLPANCSSSTANCDAAQLAEYDFHAIACGSNAYDGVQSLLPQGTMSVSCDDPATITNAICHIVVSWHELAEQGAAPVTTVSQVDLRIQP